MRQGQKGLQKSNSTKVLLQTNRVNESFIHNYVEFPMELPKVQEVTNKPSPTIDTQKKIYKTRRPQQQFRAIHIFSDVTCAEPECQIICHTSDRCNLLRVFLFDGYVKSSRCSTPGHTASTQKLYIHHADVHGKACQREWGMNDHTVDRGLPLYVS